MNDLRSEQNNQPFWFVWNPDRDIPQYRHESLDSANREAERLARANPAAWTFFKHVL